MMKVVETLAGEGKAVNRLSVSVAIAEEETSAAEFARVKAALLAWLKSGRSARGILEIEIQTQESVSSSTLREFLNVVSSTDTQMYELYKNLQETTVCTVSPSGKRIKKVGIAHQFP